MSSTITALTSGGGLAMAGDTSGQLELKTNNGTTAVTINTAQGVQALKCIGVGNATPSTSGAGITFPATQSASSDANTLDDYEEGTWTPTFAFTSGSTGITYNNQSGYYTKIGNRVVVNCYIQFLNKGSSTGNLRIEGLPFTASGSANSYTPATFWGNNFTGLTSGSWNIYIEPNQTKTGDLYRLSTATQTAVNDGQVTNNSDVMMQVTYMAA